MEINKQRKDREIRGRALIKGKSGEEEMKKEEDKTDESEHLQKLCSEIFPSVLEVILHYINISPETPYKNLQNSNNKLLDLVKSVNKEEYLSEIIIVLKQRVKKVEAKAKEICLTWFSTLFDKYSEKILIDDSDILNSIISSIDEKESKLTVYIINLICEISKKNEFFLT